MLDLSSFNKAISSLDEAVTAYQKNLANKFIRDASIQRFEYTYELSFKMIKRFLETTEASIPEVDQMSFQNLIRTAAEKGLLLNSWDEWKVYREARNLTSHTYDEDKANEVWLIIPNFLKEANYLLQELETRNTVSS